MSNNSKQSNKRSRVLLLLLLLVFVSITSSIVGYILGRHTGPQPGGTIDTIPIPPAQVVDTQLSISGVVLYSDGRPVADHTVQLHSEPMTTVTDEKGYFFFHQAISGTHMLSVLDSDGKTIATCPVELIASKNSSTVVISGSAADGYSIELPADALVVEIEVRLDGGLQLDKLTVIRNNALVQTPETVTLPTHGKPVTTVTGSTVLPDSTVIAPNKQVLLPDGSLVKPDGTVISPEGKEEKPTEKVEFENGGKFDPETMTVTTPNGTKIDLSTGQVTEPETPVKPGDFGVSSEGKSWTQETVIDLFAGIDKLYPGVEGYYSFCVTNGRDEDLLFSICVTDDHKNPIPFLLTLKDENGNEVGMEQVLLEKNSFKNYTLCWQWPYESGNDAYDTQIGTDPNPKHTVTITITAEAAA